MCLQLRDCLEQLNGSNHFNVKLCTTNHLLPVIHLVKTYCTACSYASLESPTIRCMYTLYRNLRTYYRHCSEDLHNYSLLFAVRWSPRGRGKRGGLYQAPSMRGAHDPGTAKVSGEFWSTSFLNIAHFQVIACLLAQWLLPHTM